MLRSLFALALAVGLTFAAAQADAPAAPAAPEMHGSVLDVAAGHADISTLTEAVTRAQLDVTLGDEGPYTIFAPTNEAFEAALPTLGFMSAEEFLGSPDLASVLGYHVVRGTYTAADVMAAVEAGGGSTTVETIDGETLTLTLVDGNVVVNGVATVTMADLEAGNGVVHIVDNVLVATPN
jgi:uncharacterized surface protein with fasciclin (FAS1) repeats